MTSFILHVDYGETAETFRSRPMSEILDLAASLLEEHMAEAAAAPGNDPGIQFTVRRERNDEKTARFSGSRLRP